jgi:menaquinone-specific isochorismate synthase
VSLDFAGAARPDLPPQLLTLLPPESRRDAVAWLHQGSGFVGWGEAARHDPGTGTDRFAAAAAAVADLLGEPAPGTPRPLAIAGFTFDPAAPGSFVRVPAVLVHRDAKNAARGATVTTAESGTDPATLPLPVHRLPERAAADRVRFAGASVPDLLWLDAVAAATRLIDKDELRKVVLARDHAVWSKAPFDARVLAARLAARFPECFTFIAEELVGASPELLVRRRGTAVESLVLAGSAARGEDDGADRIRGDALLSSAKDRDEHECAVASVRDVLADRCTELVVDPGPHLLRLHNVQHLATRVRGTLAAPAPTALELAGALHPTAAVGGTPTDAALTVIAALEGMDRGRYTGPVGWVDAAGDGEFAIALRCAELSGARARLFAGAGIVGASLPEAELEETRLKLRAMQSAFED